MFKGIQENDVELVKFYLNSDIDPNYQHPEFMALPLSESIRYNNITIAKILLQNGANPLVVEMETGITTLELAKRMKKQIFINLLRDYIK